MKTHHVLLEITVGDEGRAPPNEWVWQQMLGLAKGETAVMLRGDEQDTSEKARLAIEAAKEEADDELEIDQKPTLSRGDDDGYWVSAWKWVSDLKAEVNDGEPGIVFEVLENGDLALIANAATRKFLKDSDGSDMCPEIFDLFEPESCNGGYTLFDAGNGNPFVGLTSAPCIAESLTAPTENSPREVDGRLWWFPDYQVINFVEELREKGRVVFTLAPEEAVTKGQEKKMTIKIVTNFGVLLRLAKAVGEAKKSGDQEALVKAQAEHDAYKDLCLRADRMDLGSRKGAL